MQKVRKERNKKVEGNDVHSSPAIGLSDSPNVRGYVFLWEEKFLVSLAPPGNDKRHNKQSCGSKAIRLNKTENMLNSGRGQQEREGTCDFVLVTNVYSYRLCSIGSCSGDRSARQLLKKTSSYIMTFILYARVGKKDSSYEYDDPIMVGHSHDHC